MQLIVLSQVQYCFFVLQIQFKGMVLYDCGATYNPKHPENNPACTRVDDVRDTLRLQVPFFPICMHAICTVCYVIASATYTFSGSLCVVFESCVIGIVQ